ncbi:MAG: hypothetical protein AAF250_08900 [Pseudomonadota bacterium]
MAAALATPAAAQTDPDAELKTPEMINQMFECRNIEEPDARLACFDREVGKVYEAQESQEIVIAERTEVDEAKRGLFGLKLPDIKLFGGGEEDTINEITATLTRADRQGNGRYVFELENGARWVETESPPGFRRYKAGDTIVIERAALGSFKAKVNGKRAVRVRRIN